MLSLSISRLNIFPVSNGAVFQCYLTAFQKLG